jgi:hypothetical protein
MLQSSWAQAGTQLLLGPPRLPAPSVCWSCRLLTLFLFMIFQESKDSEDTRTWDCIGYENGGSRGPFLGQKWNLPSVLSEQIEIHTFYHPERGWFFQPHSSQIQHSDIEYGLPKGRVCRKNGVTPLPQVWLKKYPGRYSTQDTRSKVVGAWLNATMGHLPLRYAQRGTH